MLATANTGLAADDVFYFANLVGDCDGDGEVGGSDYGAFVGEVALSGGVGAMAADFNADGWVDLGDFAIMRGAIGNSVLTPTIPAAVTSVNPGTASDQSPVIPSTALPSTLLREIRAISDQLTANDAASAIDLLIPSPPGDISGAEAISGGLSAPAMQRAATSAYDLRPLSDAPATDAPGDDLLADILAESPLTAAL